MAMGDISRGPTRTGTPIAGRFRGSRSFRLVASLHRHQDGPGDTPIALGPYLTQASMQKAVDGKPGVFSLALKGRMLAGGGLASVDWSDVITDDDWIRIGLFDGAREWLLFVGMVDSVDLDVSGGNGADSRSWSVTGQDLTKAFLRTELINMPYVAYDLLLDYGMFYQNVQALSRLPEVGPGQVVRELYRWFMRSATDTPRTSTTRWWAVPANYPAEFVGQSVEPGARQLSDVVSEEHIDQEITGRFAVYAALLGSPNAGGQVWPIMQDYADLARNELYLDLMPPKAQGGSPLAFAAGAGGDGFTLRPSIVCREKPFPTAPGSVPHRIPLSSIASSSTSGTGHDPWSALPTTILDIEDCERVSVSRSGAERFNYFLMESGGGGFSPMVLAQAAAAGHSENIQAGLFAGVPAIDHESASLHGLQRLNLSSNYINTDPQGGDFDLFIGWTRLIRDWYALNHEYLAGEITTAFMLPGVRIGERLILRGLLAEPVQFYVEGVKQTFTKGDKGEPQSSTTLTVTRGHVDPVGAIERYVTRFRGLGQSPIAGAGAQAEAQGQPARVEALRDAEVAAALDAVQASPGVVVPPGAPAAPVTGTGPTGAPVTLPLAED